MRILGALLALSGLVSGADREVAITIDDLPRGGDGGPTTLAEVRDMTTKLLKPFHDRNIPVIGFVNQGRNVKFGADGMRQILDLWLEMGASLGNHTYSHPNINQVPLEDYKIDITKGEPILRAALSARGKKLEFFRHPYLFTGPTLEIKNALQTFLDQRGYRVAPVTFDNSDWAFAALYTKPDYRERAAREYVDYMESVVAYFERRSMEVMGGEFPQILLIHASQMNADLMPNLLDMFEKRGYKFVSLETALNHPAYKAPETYAGRNGFSWIHRWAKTKEIPFGKGEPEPAEWVTQASR